MLRPPLPSKAQFAVWLVLPLLLLCILGGYLALGYNPSKLEIVATAEGCDRHPCKWYVTGRINASDDGLLKASKVWVEAKTSRGDRILRSADMNEGIFKIGDIPDTIRSRPVTRITAHASSKGRNAQAQALDESLGGVQVGFAIVAGVFLVSLSLPFLKREPGHRLYLLSLFFAGLFALVMIAGIGWGLRDVNTAISKETIPLAFGSVTWGKFSSGAQSEWLLMLTSPAGTNGPDDATTTPTIEKGFGAPLWVLLISVVGCAILTVSLLVGEIATPPKGDTIHIRHRIQKVVRHQFFILFSPVGAIFVYQMLVVAGADSNDLTVALAALGSGVAVNSLLNVAMQHARTLIEGSRQREGFRGAVHVPEGTASRPATV